MISTLSSLMIKFGIERVYGKGHHKSVYQKALEKLEGYSVFVNPKVYHALI